jgi:hypothetical protein
VADEAALAQSSKELSPFDLLPMDALRGHRIAISVSDSPDLLRLGLTEAHFKLAVRDLARAVLLGGGTLAFGGHLRHDGYGEFLVHELGQYASAGILGGPQGTQDLALLLCLSQQDHRAHSLDELDRVDADLGLFGELNCLDLQGRRLADRTAGRSADAEPYPTDKSILAQGLTAMRRYMTDHTSARMLIGGRRHAFSGTMPGVVEEALMALNAQQPLFIAAGYGGAAFDLACAIDPGCAGGCPRHASDPQLDAGAPAALLVVSALVAQGGWSRLNNGLDDDENRHLAATHRPAEIAALVSLGLGRWAQQRVSAEPPRAAGAGS